MTDDTRPEDGQDEETTGRADERRRPNRGESPEDRRLTKRQAAYLARETGVPQAELAKLRLGELSEKLRWQLDWQSFFFQKVCGRVVKRDPVTGALYPVPFATVHVEDTDCHFLFYSPSNLGYSWIYPLWCDREEIATVQTDECGNFCVLIPRWDIDRLLRWRRERVCFPTFEPPRLIDLLRDLFPEPWPPFRKPPLPDPPPDFADVQIRREVEARLGPELGRRLAQAAPDRSFGGFRGGLDEALMEPAPKTLLPRPPIPAEVEIEGVIRDDARLENIDRLDLSRLIGPFVICRDIYVPVWQTIFDVPDVTFRVTQAQAGGDVTIYDEGYFDVRWNDTSIPDVTLEAWPNAQAVSVCDGPEIECEDTPAILNIALMPLVAAYHDDGTGYGVRVNQPSADGVTAPTPGSATGTAHAPYADRLDLFGCFHIPGATHYRVMASLEGGTAQPILAGNFTVMTTSFLLDTQVQLADGCYLIRNDLISSFEHLILGWLPDSNGTYDITLEVGTLGPGGFSPTASSAAHRVEVDGSYPVATFHQIRWWHASSPGSPTTLPAICPVIERDPSKDVVVEVTWSASAAHLRNAVLGMYGCGGGDPTPPASATDTRWWWQSPSDTTTGTNVALFTIPNGLAAGCYTAHINAVSRAYNPALPGSPLSADWYALEDRREVWPSRAISVVDV